jgi:transcriptional antiterminator RfaH
MGKRRLHSTMDSLGHSAGPVRRWHLAFTKPSAEEIAQIHLERQGYTVYLPRLQHKALQRGKWRDRISALFPRYLFVQLDAVLQSLAPIRSTVGVASVVRFGVDYMVVPDHVVDSLRRKADVETGLHQLRAADWFKRGDPVHIATGAMTGLEGIFVCEDGNHRVTILLNLLGRESRIQIDAGCVVPSAA